MSFGLTQIALIKRAKCGIFGGLQNGIRAEAKALPLFSRQIAAPLPQVQGKVTENIDQLQAFAKAHAVGLKDLCLGFVIERRSP